MPGHPYAGTKHSKRQRYASIRQRYASNRTAVTTNHGAIQNVIMSIMKERVWLVCPPVVDEQLPEFLL